MNQEKDLGGYGGNAGRGRQTKALEILSLAIEAAKMAKDKETMRVLQEETKLAREEIERVQGADGDEFRGELAT